MGVSFHIPQWYDILILGTIILGILVPLLLSPKRFLLLLKLLRPFRLIHYGGFAAGGVIMGFVIGNTPLDVYYLIYSVAAALIAFQGAVFLNDIFDAEIDMLAGKKTPFTKGVLSLRGSYILAAGLSIFSLLVVFPCGLTSVLLLLSAHVISLMYSVPLIRAKRFYPLNVFLLALAGLAVMVMGFSSHAPVLRFPLRMLILVVVTLTATFGTKDLADIEGDRERGIHTLFTLLGEKRGRWVNATLVLVAYLATPFILAYPGLFWAAVPAGLITASALLMRKLREWLVLLVYVVFGLVVLLLIALGEIF